MKEIKYVGYKEVYLDSLMSLIKEVLEVEYDFEVNEEYTHDIFNLDDFYIKPGGYFGLAVIGDEVVGSMGLEKFSEFGGCIKRFYVKKSLRRRGIGVNLLERLIKFAKDHNYKKSLLQPWLKWNWLFPFTKKMNLKEFPNCRKESADISIRSFLGWNCKECGTSWTICIKFGTISSVIFLNLVAMMGYEHVWAGFIFMKLFGLLFLLGVILFLVWAIRTLNKKQLKKWVVGLLVVGLLGMALSSLLVGNMGNWDKDGKGWDFMSCE